MMDYSRERYDKIVSSPGKFEGEKPYAPYFWELWLEGFDGEHFSDNGTLVTRMRILQEDRDLFPEIPDKATYAVIYELDTGFVLCDLENADKDMLCI